MRIALLLLATLALGSCRQATAPVTAVLVAPAKPHAAPAASFIACSVDLRADVVITVTCQGHGNYGAPGGWFVEGLFDTPNSADGWEYEVRDCDFGTPFAPSGHAPFWLEGAYGGDLIANCATTFNGQTSVTIHVPAAQVYAGHTYWIEVHDIDADGGNAGVPDDGDFTGIVARQSLGVPY